MTVFFLILAAIMLIGVTFGAAAWFIHRHRQSIESKEPDEEVAKSAGISFRWHYIIVPLAIFLLSIIISAVFYPRLPADVGYHFASGGTPDRWMSREMAMAMMLAPQLLLTLLAWGISRGIIKLGIMSNQSEIIGLQPQKMLFFMSNIVVLPQLILGFVMLDIFGYNVYQIHILPTWAFLLILALSTILLGAIFVLVVLRARKQTTHQPEE